MTTVTPSAISSQGLSQAARADTETVQGLLEQLARGSLRNPSFQRPLRWRDQDQILLLDSVLRGIPIGTILLSDPFVDGPDRDAHVRLVLDGQQRLHTFTQMLRRPESGRREILLDTESRTFRFGTVEPMDATSTLVPLGLLGDQNQLIEDLLAHDVPKRTLKTAMEVSQVLREYRVPIYHLRGATEAQARVVFDRVNVSGRRLRQSEVFDALHARDGEQHVASSRDVVRWLQTLGFGALDENDVTKTVAILLGQDPGVDVRNLDLSDPGAQMVRTRTALERALGFLIGHAEIPHRRALPYVMPMLVLAKYLDRHPDPAPRTCTLLRRWIWRGAVSGAHQGSRAPLREALSAIDDDPHASVQRLLQQVPSTAPVTSWSARAPVHLKHATDRVVLCVLASLAPRDMETGAPLDVGRLLEKRSVVSLVREPADARIWAAAILHERRRPGQLRAQLAAATPETLASHRISPEARDALRAGDVPGFLADRAAELEVRVTAFVQSHAEWGAMDHPSLARFEDAP